MPAKSNKDARFGDVWDIRHWPANIFPHEPKRAKHLIGCNRDRLVRAKVISRVGREIVVHGDRWRLWLTRPEAIEAVENFKPTPPGRAGGAS